MKKSNRRNQVGRARRMISSVRDKTVLNYCLMIDKVSLSKKINFLNHPFVKSLTEMDAICNLSKNKTSILNQQKLLLPDKMNHINAKKNH